jgi:hypothetical protein
MPVLLRTIFLLSLSTLIVACATPSLEDQPSAEFGDANLYPVNNSGFQQAFVARDAGLASYRSIDAAPLELAGLQMPTTVIRGTQRRDLQMTPERETAFQEEWAKAMDAAFRGYDLGGQAKISLKIEARLIKIEPGLRTAMTIGGTAQPMADALDISAEFRLSDAGSGRLLAVIRDTRSITAGALSRTAPATLNQLFGSWAALLHTRVSGR